MSSVKEEIYNINVHTFFKNNILSFIKIASAEVTFKSLPPINNDHDNVHTYLNHLILPYLHNHYKSNNLISKIKKINPSPNLACTIIWG